MSTPIYSTITELLKKVGVTGAIELGAPPKADMGDFAFACFALAKEQKQKPNEVAAEIVQKLANGKWKMEMIEKVQAFGPYVNFFVKPGALASLVIQDILKRGEKYGMAETEKPERVMVEFSQPNTHKEFHVGHLRNVSIGSTIVNLFKANGYNTLAANYVGDIGAHVAKCLWYMQKYAAGQTPESGRGKWLGMLYAKATQHLEEHPEEQPEVSITQQKLESGDAALLALWAETKEWSMEGFHSMYATLGTHFDEWFFESEVEKPGKEMVRELLDKEVAEFGDRGAVIVNLEEYGLDTFLILKSDGTSLYATKDLALAKKKFLEYKIDKSIYVVDNRQRFYFKQLFKTLELLGWHKDMFFLGYDFVTLPEGAMSSRKGNVVLFEDLYNQVKKIIVEEELGSRHADWVADKKEAVGKTIALAAIKFDILKHPTDKVITFNIKEATSFEGFSGPYLLYVVARVNSIIRKAEVEKYTGEADYNVLTSPEEKKLVLMMGEYQEVLAKALEQYNPSVVARYCFDLAQAFNDFYAKHSILNAEGNAITHARLVLATAVQRVLKNALGVLSIETVEEM